MAWLPNDEKSSKISLFVLTQLTNVIDRQTDRHRMPAIAALMRSIERQKSKASCVITVTSVTCLCVVAINKKCGRRAHTNLKFLGYTVRNIWHILCLR